MESVINLFDNNFPTQACSVAGQTAEKIRYVRNQTDWDGLTLFTDGWMFSEAVDQVESRYKLGWLHEGRALHPENYTRSIEVRDKFDRILTYDSDLLLTFPRAYRYCIRGGIWTPRDQWALYPKTKDVAMIISEKTALPGHQLRHMIAALPLGIDLYGAMGTPIGHDKSLAYTEYRYAVVVEASRELNFFTEHLLDALMFGCVPIYWGCPNIGIWLNKRGILTFTDLVELVSQLEAATPAHYRVLRPVIEENFREAQQYAVTEDWMATSVLKPFLEGLA